MAFCDYAGALVVDQVIGQRPRRKRGEMKRPPISGRRKGLRQNILPFCQDHNPADARIDFPEPVHRGGPRHRRPRSEGRRLVVR